MLKGSRKWGNLAVLAVFLVFGACENAANGITEDDLKNYQKIGDPAPFITTDPSLGTLDNALAYFPKWVSGGVQGEEEDIYTPWFITFTPTKFSFSSAFAGIPKGSYPYTLTKDGTGYILKIAAWFQSTPGSVDSLVPIAKITYDPVKLALVFTNATEDDDYWAVEGDTFIPDLTEYYTATSFVSSSYVYVENNIPASTANKVGVISFNASGSLVTSDASQVFTSAAVNNKSAGIAWSVVGKDRKLIAANVDLGTISIDPDKPFITLGGKKFAQRIALCGFICSYQEVDCCPYINGYWTAVDSENNPLTDSNQAYFRIMAGQGTMLVQKASDNNISVDASVYGTGLADFPNTLTSAYGIWVADDLTVYSQIDNQPLLTFVNLEAVDSTREGVDATHPDPRIITIRPAVEGAQVIRLKKTQ